MARASLFVVGLTAALLASGAACNQIAGINEPIDADGGGGAGADGGASNDAHVTPEAAANDPAAAYIGDWRNRGTGTVTLNCNGQSQQGAPDAITVSIARQDGQLIYVDSPCTWNVTLGASGLSFPANQTCDADDSINGEPVTDHFVMGSPSSFKLVGDGKRATLDTVGTVVIKSKVSTATQSCDLTQHDEFDRQ